MMRALFYRGRHHVRTAQRSDDGGLVTVDTIAARISRERFEANMAWLRAQPAAALARYAEQCIRARSEGLGALAL